MMNFFRKHVRIIFIVTILAFTGAIIFGAIANFRGSNDYAVKINGKKVPLPLYTFIYENTLEYYQKKSNSDLSDSQKQELKTSILQTLVQDEVFYQQSKDYQIFITDEELRVDLENSPQFSENGTFSSTKYMVFLKAARMNPKEYEHLRKKQLASLRLKILLASSVKLWNYEIDSKENKTKEDLFNIKVNTLLGEWYQQILNNSKIVSNDIIFS